MVLFKFMTAAVVIATLLVCAQALPPRGSGEEKEEISVEAVKEENVKAPHNRALRSVVYQQQQRMRSLPKFYATPIPAPTSVGGGPAGYGSSLGGRTFYSSLPAPKAPGLSAFNVLASKTGASMAPDYGYWNSGGGYNDEMQQQGSDGVWPGAYGTANGALLPQQPQEQAPIYPSGYGVMGGGGVGVGGVAVGGSSSPYAGYLERQVAR